ncbi:MAG: TrkA C-terminal domain-containing protein [Duncaniella sp.]|nr:TrkA C-terminal domain-containing protein [Duncaniella sp.]
MSSIQRGNEMILVPDADARIFPGDVLGVIGTDEEIQAMLPVIESAGENDTDAPKSGDIKLTSVRLGENSPIVGRTVAQADLSHTFSALLVSVQRGDEFLQPDAKTVFMAGDTIWVVGDKNRLSEIE